MKSMKNMKVLIAGGAGFLGSHLCDKFFANGCDVFCIDNFYTGHKRNIVHLINYSSKQFSVINFDIVDPYPYYKDDIDLILNFACPASPIHYQKDPIKTMQISVIGTMNLLKLATDTDARFLQASTSEVYGDPTPHPQPESYWGNVNPIGIRSCYDEGKRAAESLCFDYHRTYGTDIRVVRIFNTYGPRMAIDDGRVVSNFIVQALLGEDITIYGDGSQTRSFCYCDDLIDGIYRIAVRETEEGKFLTGPFNLGNEQEFTILELAEEVLKLTNSKSKIVRKALPQDDPQLRKPDMTKTKNIFSFEAKTPLKEGLSKTIDYFKEVLHT